eukprot:CAMPEP_0176183760 /NCGR_PEP_ID=MMETSP0121_2-20121125/459_1 /TAXON_ID=160619 /ORGANISM="Kryptoperidinium foliaceum, Strain CCMP 1326" /LENGTH=304 /DNA_ID=CAMNT_0017522101 /DNA_START=206 /DNA_END=1116 /DNA_ORIENTATION=-
MDMVSRSTDDLQGQCAAAALHQAQLEGATFRHEVAGHPLEEAREVRIDVCAADDPEDARHVSAEDLRHQRAAGPQLLQRLPRPRGFPLLEQAALEARLQRVGRVRQGRADGARDERGRHRGRAVGQAGVPLQEPCLEQRRHRHVGGAEVEDGHGAASVHPADTMLRKNSTRARSNRATAVLLVDLDELEGRLHHGGRHASEGARHEAVGVGQRVAAAPGPSKRVRAHVRGGELHRGDWGDRSNSNREPSVAIPGIDRLREDESLLLHLRLPEDRRPHHRLLERAHEAADDAMLTRGQLWNSGRV